VVCNFALEDERVSAITRSLFGFHLKERNSTRSSVAA
jgi:hypothetical protein